MPRKPNEPPLVCEHFTWHLRRKPSGIYYADGRSLNKYDLGKQSLGTRDHKKALQELRELDRVMAIEHGLIEPESQDMPDDVSIEHGWQLYIERCEQPEILDGVSEPTQKRYRPVRVKHVKFCAKKGYTHWSQITKQTSKKYGAWLAKEEYADRTIVLELNLVCSVSKWLVEGNHLPQSCQFSLKLSKPAGSPTYCYTKQEVIRMIRFCEADPKLVWLGQAITALATTGLRINELTKLRWSDIDFQSNTIRLTDERARSRRKQTGKERRLKGKRGRAVPMNPALLAVLKVLPRNKDGLVFHGQKGGKLRDRQVLKTLQKTVIESLKNEFPTPQGETGFTSGTVHGLRHYFCSEAYRGGATDAELLAWLGHRSSEIMELYRHLRPEDAQRRMLQINFLDGDDEGDCENNVA